MILSTENVYVSIAQKLQRIRPSNCQKWIQRTRKHQEFNIWLSKNTYVEFFLKSVESSMYTFLTTYTVRKINTGTVHQLIFSYYYLQFLSIFISIHM